MVTQGSFGYKIGRKIRLMNVQFDADLLWQICVREIYVLLKHYETIEKLREAFDNLKDAKGTPKKEIIEKCEPYTNLTVSKKSTNDWNCLLRNCQHSFINVLDTGYFLNDGHNSGLVFILDFNMNTAVFYSKDFENKITEHEKATIEEIMSFDDMPTKTYTEIITEFKERFENHKKKLKDVEKEMENIKNIINKANELGGEQNIIDKAKKLLDDMKWEKKKVEIGYRYFYHRLDVLNLIDYNS
jgi:hypothetical protein